MLSRFKHNNEDTNMSVKMNSGEQSSDEKRISLLVNQSGKTCLRTVNVSKSTSSFIPLLKIHNYQE